MNPFDGLPLFLFLTGFTPAPEESIRVLAVKPSIVPGNIPSNLFSPALVFSLGTLIGLAAALRALPQPTTCPPTSTSPTCPNVVELEVQLTSLQQQVTTLQTQINEFTLCTGFASRIDCEAEPRCIFDNNCKPA